MTERCENCRFFFESKKSVDEVQFYCRRYPATVIGSNSWRHAGTSKNNWCGEYKSVELECSFCGKGQKEVKNLIAGPDAYICDECVDLCNEILAEEFFKEKEEVADWQAKGEE